MAHIDKIRNAQRHERLRELMAAKVEKMVKTGLTDKQREFIRQEVDLLIHNGDASEGSLQRVAGSLRVFNATEKAVAPAKASTSRAPADASTSRDAQPRREAGTPQLQESSVQRRALPHELHADDVWAQLCRKDAEEYNREILEHRKLIKRKEDEQRHFLEAQVRRREELRAKQTEEERAAAQREQEQSKIWQSEEQKKKDEQKKKFAAERQLRDEQMRIATEKKLREEEARREEDRRQAEQIRALVQKEEEVNEQKKLHTKEEVTRFQAINKKYEDEKQKLREQEAEMDKVHQRLFLERLTKQERERDEALAKMHEKQKHQQSMASQMQASVAEKAADDERKAKEYAAKKEAAFEAEQRRKQEKQAQEKTKIKQFLSMQILEKDHQRAEERERMERLRDTMKKEQEEAERLEFERQLRKKQKQDTQRKMLEEQMDERTHQKPTFMTEEERRLNAKLIEKALSPAPPRR